jgi:hypothetical protein
MGRWLVAARHEGLSESDSHEKRSAVSGRNQKRAGNDEHCQEVDPNRVTLLRDFPEGDQDFSPGQGQASCASLAAALGAE